MKPFAVIIYGPPGSGKSTQAELLARTYDLIYFDTGRHIAEILHDPRMLKQPLIRRQKELFESGQLCDRPWVYRMVAKQVRRIIASGYGLVLAGSPRGAYEALDAGTRKGVYSLLRDGYGKTGIYTFELSVHPEISVKRNTVRKVCRTCRRAYLKLGQKTCPVCMQMLIKRPDDAAQVIRGRLEAYRNETVPIFAEVKKMGYQFTVLDGEMPPFKVFDVIRSALPKL